MDTSLHQINNEIVTLRKKLREANRAYYVDSQPVMRDIEFDKLFDRLKKLESEFPQFFDENSPTLRVGSDTDSTFPEMEHSIPVLSLDKCYSISDLESWISKIEKKFPGRNNFTIEPKIDGASVVLYYDKGKLQYALTRGNGFIGNEITANIRTIGSVPLVIDYPGKLAVRGEIYINKADFKIFNDEYADGKYSNPRNLASGSLRRQKSSETSKYPLGIFLYDGFFTDKSFERHVDILIYLKELGFTLNDHIGFFGEKSQNTDLSMFSEVVTGSISDIDAYLKKQTEFRHSLQFEIDGLVIKVDDLAIREELGFTQHHPRWSIAWKFEAPLTETLVESIECQVGRSGRLTPVANLMPVELAGSTISRATLHNQDYITWLGVNIGDRVSISKRGDVIPAVEEVLEKGEFSSPWLIADSCPSCKKNLTEDGAHLFCLNDECPARLLGRLQYFCHKGQMDIESLGDKTIEYLFKNRMVRYINEIYTFDYTTLEGHEGFGEKKINNIIAAVVHSKKKDFVTILCSLGLTSIGHKAAELFVEKYLSIDQLIEIAQKEDLEAFSMIDGIGDGIAQNLINHLQDPAVLKVIDGLRQAGLHFEAEKKPESNEPQFLENTKWVITGSFENYKPRDKAADLIKLHGGKISAGVSSNTNFLLAGKEAGSKLAKAEDLGITILNEEEFVKIMNEKRIDNK